jgi:hypothetical protein
VAEVSVTDLLERPTGQLTAPFDLTLRPFQILTLRLTPGSSDG